MDKFPLHIRSCTMPIKDYEMDLFCSGRSGHYAYSSVCTL